VSFGLAAAFPDKARTGPALADVADAPDDPAVADDDVPAQLLIAALPLSASEERHCPNVPRRDPV
jgi:hypothetical protein